MSMMALRRQVIKGTSFKGKAIEVVGGTIPPQIGDQPHTIEDQVTHRDESHSSASSPHSSEKTNSFKCSTR